MKAKTTGFLLICFSVATAFNGIYAQSKDIDFVPIRISDTQWEYRLKNENGKPLIQLDDCKQANAFVYGFAKIESATSDSYFIDYQGNSPTPSMMYDVRRLGSSLFSYYDALGAKNETPRLYFYNVQTKTTTAGPEGATAVYAARNDAKSEAFVLLINFPEITIESYPAYSEWGDEIYDENGELVYIEYENYTNHWYVYNEELVKIYADELETFEFNSANMLYTECLEYEQNYYSEGDEYSEETEYTNDNFSCPMDMYHNPIIADNFYFNGQLFTFSTADEAYFGAIDYTGKLVIPFILEQPRPDEAGYFLFSDQNSGGSYGFMNSSGKVVIKAAFSDALAFDATGTAVVALKGKYGVINKKGKFIVKPVYDFISYTDPKQMRLVERGGLSGKINAKGKIIIPVIYQELFDWGTEMMFAKKNNLVGIIDNAGRELLSFRFADVANIIPEKRLAIVVTTNGKFGVARFNVGTSEPIFLIPAEYSHIESTNGGFILTANNKKGFADETGQLLTPIEFDQVYYYREGILQVTKNNMIGLYSTSGDLIVEPIYQSIKEWNGLHICKSLNNSVFVNEKGQIVQPEVSKKGAAMVDQSGNNYQTVIINGKQWMAENLRTTKFVSGDPIPHAKTAAEWMDAAKNGKPAWCYYNNDKANEAAYGILYNWYAIVDERGIVPDGWQVPLWSDYSELTDFLGIFIDKNEESLIMKGQGWKISTTEENNSSGFNASPSGIRYVEQGLFANGGYSAGWWLSDNPEPYYGEPGEELSGKGIAIQPNYHHMQFLYIHRGAGLAVRAFNPYPTE